MANGIKKKSKPWGWQLFSLVNPGWNDETSRINPSDCAEQRRTGAQPTEGHHEIGLSILFVTKSTNFRFGVLLIFSGSISAENCFSQVLINPIVLRKLEVKLDQEVLVPFISSFNSKSQWYCLRCNQSRINKRVGNHLCSRKNSICQFLRAPKKTPSFSPGRYDKSRAQQYY